MARTGSAWLMAVFLLGSMVARAEDAPVGFSASVDRTEVGLEDILELTIATVDAPRNAKLTYPSMDAFEVVRRNQSTQTSVQFGSGGTSLQRTTQYILLLRPLKVGTFTIPPASLEWGKESRRTESIRIKVAAGSKGDASQRGNKQRQRRGGSPFGGMLPPGFEDLDRAFGELAGESEVPRSEQDLFLRLAADKKDLYVGEQATVTLSIYSRVELASVDSVTVPKFEGFWSEDLDAPTQLVAEIQSVNGVPYKRYLLRRKAVFPVRAGTLKVEPAESDITAGFLFAAHKLHRNSNPLVFNVKPLPAGANAGFSATQVGQWKLSLETDRDAVPLGDPLTIRVVLEGSGNLNNVRPPKPVFPEGLKAYEPTPKDEPATKAQRLGGKRVLEYLVKPERTGSFVIPGLEFQYFDPEKGIFETTRTAALTVKVGSGAGLDASAPTGIAEPDNRNVLDEHRLQALRAQGRLSAAGEAIWQRPWFQSLLAFPWVGALGFAVFRFLRRHLGRVDPVAVAKKKAEAESQARVAAAFALIRQGSSEAFHAELERGLEALLEVRLGRARSQGVTREELLNRLRASGVAEPVVGRVRSLLEACEVGRYAPTGLQSQRAETLQLAETVFTELKP